MILRSPSICFALSDGNLMYFSPYGLATREKEQCFPRSRALRAAICGPTLSYKKKKEFGENRKRENVRGKKRFCSVSQCSDKCRSQNHFGFGDQELTICFVFHKVCKC